MSKATKAKRRRLIPADLRERINALDDETVLAVHDLTHELMDRRCGSNKRSDFSRAALATKEPADHAK